MLFRQKLAFEHDVIVLLPLLFDPCDGLFRKLDRFIRSILPRRQSDRAPNRSIRRTWIDSRQLLQDEDRSIGRRTKTFEMLETFSN